MSKFYCTSGTLENLYGYKSLTGDYAIVYCNSDQGVTTGSVLLTKLDARQLRDQLTEYLGEDDV